MTREMLLTWTPVLIIALAIPLILGVVPRNWFYGVRTSRTLASDEAWYPANRVGGWIMALVGIGWLAYRLLG